MGICEGLELVDGIRWYRVTTTTVRGYMGLNSEDRLLFGAPAAWLELFRAWPLELVLEDLRRPKVKRIKDSEVDHVHEDCHLCHGEWPCDELSTPKHPCKEKMCLDCWGKIFGDDRG